MELINILEKALLQLKNKFHVETQHIDLFFSLTQIQYK